MLWIVSCIDRPDSQTMRAELLATHRKYLDTVNHQIFFSGPQQRDDASGDIGSFFIINAPDRAAAQAFIEGETFYRAGLFQSVTITRVRKGRFQPALAESV